MKIAKNTLPAGHTFSDFKCFGPIAQADGQFAGTSMADLGYFKDNDDKDSNKRYFGCKCQSKIDSSWFTYNEYGRTGMEATGYQFEKHSSESAAQTAYEDQMHKKNDKRGEWKTVGTLKILTSKPGKDCYLVRVLASRDCNLPDARNLTVDQPVVLSSKVKAPSSLDQGSFSLLNDLNVMSSSYTRSNIVGGVIPSKSAIDEARTILQLATLASNHNKKQDLVELTEILYSKIPKYKAKNVDVTLSAQNINAWSDELDVFDQASVSSSYTEDSYSKNLPFEIETLHGKEFDLVKNWFMGATQKRHSYIRSMNVYNIWRIKHTHSPAFLSKIKTIQKTSPEKPLHQTLDLKKGQEYTNSGTYSLFHGTRSVNVGGILREFFRMPAQLKGVHISGSAFGAGIYHADDWGKSAGYISSDTSYWNKGAGKLGSRHSFIFINDVCLGNSYMPTRGGDYWNNVDGKKYHSVFAELNKCTVANNEFIVFDNKQVNMNFLVEMDIR